MYSALALFTAFLIQDEYLPEDVPSKDSIFSDFDREERFLLIP